MFYDDRIMAFKWVKGVGTYRIGDLNCVTFDTTDPLRPTCMKENYERFKHRIEWWFAGYTPEEVLEKERESAKRYLAYTSTPNLELAT